MLSNQGSTAGCPIPRLIIQTLEEEVCNETSKHLDNTRGIVGGLNGHGGLRWCQTDAYPNTSTTYSHTGTPNGNTGTAHIHTGATYPNPPGTDCKARHLGG